GPNADENININESENKSEDESEISAKGGILKRSYTQMNAEQISADQGKTTSLMMEPRQKQLKSDDSHYTCIYQYQSTKNSFSKECSGYVLSHKHETKTQTQQIKTEFPCNKDGTTGDEIYELKLILPNMFLNEIHIESILPYWETFPGELKNASKFFQHVHKQYQNFSEEMKKDHEDSLKSLVVYEMCYQLLSESFLEFFHFLDDPFIQRVVETFTKGSFYLKNSERMRLSGLLCLMALRIGGWTIKISSLNEYLKDDLHLPVNMLAIEGILNCQGFEKISETDASGAENIFMRLTIPLQKIRPKVASFQGPWLLLFVLRVSYCRTKVDFKKCIYGVARNYFLFPKRKQIENFSSLLDGQEAKQTKKFLFLFEINSTNKRNLMAQAPLSKEDVTQETEKSLNLITDVPKETDNTNSKDVRCRMCDAVIFKKGAATHIQSQKTKQNKTNKLECPQSKIHGYTGKECELVNDWWKIENQNDFDNICGGGSKKADDKIEVSIENVTYPFEDYHIKYLACSGPSIQLSSADINIDLDDKTKDQNSQQQQLLFALQQLLSAQPLSDCEKTKGVIGVAVFKGGEFQKGYVACDRVSYK
ncbi:hypothetical protein RFI_01538, partial [Reticulomyxa filosa]